MIRHKFPEYPRPCAVVLILGAVSAALTLAGGLRVQHSLGISPARPVQAQQVRTTSQVQEAVPAVSSYGWYNFGTQLWILSFGHNHQVKADGLVSAEYTRGYGISYSGLGYYRYYDANTGDCLKVDPNISGRPVVEAGCATSGTTLEEEQFSDAQPATKGIVFNLYMQKARIGGDMAASSVDGSVFWYTPAQGGDYFDWTLG